jgi:hypothetical protein
VVSQSRRLKTRGENLLARLLGEENGVNVRQDTSRRNRDASQELVELLVILHGKSNLTWRDTGLLVVASVVASELLENGGEVHRSTGTHAGGVLALTKVTSDTTDGKLQTGLGRRGRALLLATASFSFSCLTTSSSHRFCDCSRHNRRRHNRSHVGGHRRRGRRRRVVVIVVVIDASDAHDARGRALAKYSFEIFKTVPQF